MTDAALTAARRALADCDAVVDRLHELCCEPNRSPRMLAIKEALDAVRVELDASSTDPDAVDRALGELNRIGSQIGWLQIGCCTAARMPLYADALAHLNTAQLSITAHAGKGH